MTSFDGNRETIEVSDIAADGADTIYGAELPAMRALMYEVLDHVNEFRAEEKTRTGADPVDHCLARIKSDASMREKLARKGCEATAENALHAVHDAIGVRVVCSFLNDVYTIRDFLAACPEYEIVAEKDYIRHAKPNGYRSYHLILRVRGKYTVEVQLRTISMDTWAALEHRLHYKKGIRANDPLIVSELKRCADELASTDVSMQTIRDMIYGEF